MAYGFDLEIESSSSSGEEEEVEEDEDEDDSTQKAMVPFADLFNADGDLNNVNPSLLSGRSISKTIRRTLFNKRIHWPWLP